MNRAADEFRQAIHRCPAWSLISIRARREFDASIDAFETGHPGLIDYSEPCCKCGTLLNPATSGEVREGIICAQCDPRPIISLED